MYKPELTAKGRYYRVYVDGVETTKHTTEREASESSINQKIDNPDAHVVYRHDYEVEVTLHIAGGGGVGSPPNPGTIAQISGTSGLVITGSGAPAGLPITGRFISSSTGNDGNPGTVASPWKTLSAISGASPGENIWLLADDTWTNEKLTVTHGGSFQDHVTVGTYYLDGGTGRKWIEGQGERAYINYSQGFDSAEDGSEVVSVQNDFVTLQDLKVHTGNHTFTTGAFVIQVIDVIGRDSVTVDNVEIVGWTTFAETWGIGTGIQITGFQPQNSTNIVVKNCTAYNLYNFARFAGAQNQVYENNLSYDIFHNHYFVSGIGAPHDFNTVIQNNDIRNSYRSDGVQTSGGGAQGAGNRNVLIRDNVFFGGDGSDVDAGGALGTLAENAIDLKGGAEINILRNIISGVEGDFDGDHDGQNQQNPTPNAILVGNETGATPDNVLIRENIIF